MKYKLAIFDMDGTILDTLEDLADSLNHILQAEHYPERTIDEVRNFVGNGIRKLIERALPKDATQDEIQRIFELFLPYYQKHSAIKTKPYDGILPLLKELRVKGIATAVVSNKADVAVQELCQVYFSDLFDFSIGEKAGNNRKPAPDAVYETLDTLHFSKSEAVYIGDSDVDLATARNSGLDCIAVSWGFRSEDFLKEQGADCIVHAPKQILDIMM